MIKIGDFLVVMPGAPLLARPISLVYAQNTINHPLRLDMRRNEMCLFYWGAWLLILVRMTDVHC